ncbi:hypothetical protein [Nesterenkonia pannonica]|uniref:hypothetical protein n=1 Tax=Nesterenkonia pannonica TaxID=1548602 RepID=UPI0021641889|nr:hypothetical protein [Nesterenkonia pannonica]
MGTYGIAVTRWNGQDHDGNSHTIPQRFGLMLTLVAPLDENGDIPSPRDSARVFRGSDIDSRGGGTSMIGFNGYGEFAIWHQMQGWDGRTLSELSEPLVVDVPPLFDPAPLKSTLEDLNTRVGPALEKSISATVSETATSLDQFRVEWDENWDPEVFDTLRAVTEELDETLAQKADTSRLNELNDMLSGRERVHIGEGEPDDETGAFGETYAWDGTPHDSTSAKRRNGIDVQRNLIANPSFEQGLERLTHTSTGGELGNPTSSWVVTHGSRALRVEFNGATANAQVRQPVLGWSRATLAAGWRCRLMCGVASRAKVAARPT